MPWTEASLEDDSPAAIPRKDSLRSVEINEARSSRGPSELLNCVFFGLHAAVR